MFYRIEPEQLHARPTTPQCTPRKEKKKAKKRPKNRMNEKKRGIKSRLKFIQQLRVSQLQSQSHSIAEDSTRSTQCDDELALRKNITVGFTIHAHPGPNITVTVTKIVATSHRILVLLLPQVVKIWAWWLCRGPTPRPSEFGVCRSQAA